MKLYVVQMERCQGNIKLYQRQIRCDLLRMTRELWQIERDVLQMKREEEQIAFEEEEIEPVFLCLVFDRSVLLPHPLRMECGAGALAVLRCLFIRNRK